MEATGLPPALPGAARAAAKAQDEKQKATTVANPRRKANARMAVLIILGKEM
jgi:hypothetical protein